MARLEQPDPFAPRPLQTPQRYYGPIRPRAVLQYSRSRFSSLDLLPLHHGTEFPQFRQSA
jgi:hypothetical protein